jgi:hypothetical protein
MGLDSAVITEVTAIKRLSFSQLRVEEFSNDSVFQDPSLHYILKDVVLAKI